MPKKCAECSKKAENGKSRCASCRERHSKSAHAARKRKVDATVRFRCAGCDTEKLSSAFPDGTKTRSATALCTECVDAEVEIKKCLGNCSKWHNIECFTVSTRVCDGGKRIARCAPCQEKHLEKAIERSKTANGKAIQKRYREGEAGTAANKRYREGEAGQARTKRYREGAAGLAKARRGSRRRNKLRMLDPSMQMMNAINCAARHLIRGSHETSPTFVARTGRSEASFLSSLEAKAAQLGFDWDDRDSYQMEHQIPIEAYNHTDAIDRKRCWSKANVTLATAQANKEKGIQIIDELCVRVGAQNWPKSWEGKIPDEAARQVFYERTKAQHPLVAGGGFDSDDDEGDEEEDSDEDSDDEELEEEDSDSD